jgi:hypothetical protein
MSKPMARLSKEHYAPVERARTPVKSSAKNRFTNIFKSSPRNSPPGSSMNTVERDHLLKPSVVEVGLQAVSRARSGDVEGRKEHGASSPFPLTTEKTKSQELVSWIAVDKTLDLSATTDAEVLVDEWQAEAEAKKEELKIDKMSSSGDRCSELSFRRITSGNWSKYPNSEDVEGGIVDSWDKHMADISSQSNPRLIEIRKADLSGLKEDLNPYANPEYFRHHTMDEMVKVNPEWLNYSPEEDENGTNNHWSRRVDDVYPKSAHYSRSNRVSWLDSARSSRAVEKGTPIGNDTVDSEEERETEALVIRSPSTPTTDRLCVGEDKHNDIGPYHTTAKTFSPIMEEYTTELGEIIQDNRVMNTGGLGVTTAEHDITQVDGDLDEDASIDSIPSPSRFIVDTALLQQLYEHGVPTPEGVQFYVNRKIQEAIHAHENKLHTPSSHRHIDVPKALKVGPILITDPILVSHATQAVRLIYYAILFAAAIAGPKTFFVWVWKMAIFWCVYEIVTREFGLKDEEAPDLLLEPLHHGVEELLGMGENAALRLGYMLGPFIGGIVKRVVDDDEESEAEE